MAMLEKEKQQKTHCKIQSKAMHFSGSQFFSLILWIKSPFFYEILHTSDNMKHYVCIMYAVQTKLINCDVLQVFILVYLFCYLTESEKNLSDMAWLKWRCKLVFPYYNFDPCTELFLCIERLGEV